MNEQFSDEIKPGVKLIVSEGGDKPVIFASVLRANNGSEYRISCRAHKFTPGYEHIPGESEFREKPENVLAINATEADFDWMVEAWKELESSRKRMQLQADETKAKATDIYRANVLEHLGIELPGGE